MSLQIAAIVKGLVEQGDGTVHFGSLLGYGYHMRAAKNAGVVADGQNGLMVTPAGMEWYKSERMEDLSGGVARGGDLEKITTGHRLLTPL